MYITQTHVTLQMNTPWYPVLLPSICSPQCFSHFRCVQQGSQDIRYPNIINMVLSYGWTKTVAALKTVGKMDQGMFGHFIWFVSIVIQFQGIGEKIEFEIVHHCYWTANRLPRYDLKDSVTCWKCRALAMTGQQNIIRDWKSPGRKDWIIEKVVMY